MLVTAPRRNATTEFKECWCSVHGRPYVVIAQFYHDLRLVDLRLGGHPPKDAIAHVLPNGGYSMRRKHRHDPSFYRVLFDRRDEAEIGGLPESELLSCPHCAQVTMPFFCSRCGCMSCVGPWEGVVTCFRCKYSIWTIFGKALYSRTLWAGHTYLRYESL
ncbi:MAG: hypothetical protein AAF449_00670 [Myxococcota bacterium]